MHPAQTAPARFQQGLYMIAPVWSQPVQIGCLLFPECLLFPPRRAPIEGRVSVQRRPFEGRVDAVPARVARFSPPFVAAAEASSLTYAALRARALAARRRRARLEGLPVRLRQCSASRAAQGLCSCSSTRDKAAALHFSLNMLLSLARLRFISASSFEHRPGAITLPSAAVARPLCLNPVLLGKRRGGGASALPIPAQLPRQQPRQQEAADGCANGAVAALPRPHAREVAACPPPRRANAAVAMRAALARRLREWRDCFRCAPLPWKLAAAPLWPCAEGPWRHSIGDARGPAAAAVQRQASPPATPHRATEAVSLCAKGPRWRAASAWHRPGWRGYYVCAPQPPKLAAGLLQHCAQGPLRDDAGEGGATTSSGCSAAPDAPHRAAAALRERAAAVSLSSFIMLLISIASFGLTSASSFWASTRRV